MHVVREDHRVRKKIKLVVADAENGWAIHQPPLGVLCDQFRIRPAFSAVRGASCADDGFALKLFFPVVVPGGKKGPVEFNDGRFMQKLVFIRQLDGEGFPSIRERAAFQCRGLTETETGTRRWWLRFSDAYAESLCKAFAVSALSLRGGDGAGRFQRVGLVVFHGIRTASIHCPGDLASPIPGVSSR